jgi:anti-sigma-K factor RskA
VKALLLRPIWDDAREWRRAAIVLATTALALLVAAVIARPAPDFGELRTAAVLRDAGGQPGWGVRVARAAHEIAIDSFSPLPPPPGMTYQLWLSGPGLAAPQPICLLPIAGRKVVAVIPANLALFAGISELTVTVEPANRGLASTPGWPPLYRAGFAEGG